jgi:hypothetical protein
MEAECDMAHACVSRMQSVGFVSHSAITHVRDILFCISNCLFSRVFTENMAEAEAELENFGENENFQGALQTLHIDIVIYK